MAPPAESQVADILAPVAVDTAYSYRVPAGLQLAPGDFVIAPLGTRQATGVVWAVRRGGGDNLKSVSAKRDLPPLRAPCSAWPRAPPRLPNRRPRNTD